MQLKRTSLTGEGDSILKATPIRLCLSRTRGFTLQHFSMELNGLPAKAVVRPHKWGNPFPVTEHQSARQAVSLYEASVNNHRTRKLIQKELRGFNLACFCKIWSCTNGHEFGNELVRPTPLPIDCPTCGATLHEVPCHASILLAIANEPV